jgi:hypothetical protein
MTALPAALLAGGCLALGLTSVALAEALPPRTAAPAPENMQEQGVAGVAGPCGEGLVKDDGSADTGWGWVPSVIEGEYVQVYDSAELPSRAVSSVCVCFLRTGNDPNLDFEVVFYEDVDGLPAAEPYLAIPAQITVPLTGVPNATFVEVPLPEEVPVPFGTFYVGPRWDANANPFFFLCADTNPATPRTNVFFRDDRAKGEWDNIFETGDPLFQTHRAVLVRLVGAVAGAVEVPMMPTGLAFLAIGLACAAFWRMWRP